VRAPNTLPSAAIFCARVIFEVALPNRSIVVPRSIAPVFVLASRDAQVRHSFDGGRRWRPSSSSMLRIAVPASPPLIPVLASASV
jgi:hypothetical protein